MGNFLKKHHDIVKRTEYLSKKIKANKSKLVKHATHADEGEIIEILFSLFKKISLEDLEKYEMMCVNCPTCMATILNYKSKHYSSVKQERFNQTKINKTIARMLLPSK
jgi:hypothetical protein